jgi:hypothetical protein
MTAGRASPSTWVGWTPGNWAALVLSSCIGILIEMSELLKIPLVVEMMVFVNQWKEYKNMRNNSPGAFLAE